MIYPIDLAELNRCIGFK